MATIAATMREEARKYNLELVAELRNKISLATTDFLVPVIVNKKYVDRSKLANLVEAISNDTDVLKARIEKAKTIGPVVAGKWGKEVNSLVNRTNLLHGTYRAAQQTSTHIQDSIKSVRKKINAYMKELGPRFQEPEVAAFHKVLLETRARLNRHSKQLHKNFQDYIDRYDANSDGAHNITTTLMAIAMAEKQLEEYYKKVSVPKRYVYSEADMVFNSQAAPGSVMVWSGNKNTLLGAIIKATVPFVHPQTETDVKPNSRVFIPFNPKIKYAPVPGTYQEVKEQLIKNINTIMEQVNG